MLDVVLKLFLSKNKPRWRIFWGKVRLCPNCQSFETQKKEDPPATPESKISFWFDKHVRSVSITCLSFIPCRSRVVISGTTSPTSIVHGEKVWRGQNSRNFCRVQNNFTVSFSLWPSSGSSNLSFPLINQSMYMFCRVRINLTNQKSWQSCKDIWALLFDWHIMCGEPTLPSPGDARETQNFKESYSNFEDKIKNASDHGHIIAFYEFYSVNTNFHRCHSSYQGIDGWTSTSLFREHFVYPSQAAAIIHLQSGSWPGQKSSDTAATEPSVGLQRRTAACRWRSMWKYIPHVLIKWCFGPIYFLMLGWSWFWAVAD